jgi:hypothetical protein
VAIVGPQAVQKLDLPFIGPPKVASAHAVA